MGVFGQLGLILKKNLILRGRQPFILFLEVIWPIAIFVAVALVRQAIPPTEVPQCSYNARSMPSAGVLPFMQSFMCNIENKCQEKGMPNNIPQAGKRIMQLQKSIDPLLGDEGGAGSVLQDVPKVLDVMDSLSETLERPEVKNLLDFRLTVGDLFRNRTEVTRYLTKETGILTEDTAEALMNATFNLTQLLQLAGNLNFKEIICNEVKLRSYLVFRSSDNVSDISQALCSINDSQTANIVETLQKQIDVAKIMRIVGLIKEFKEDYTLGKAFKDVAKFLDLLSNTSLVQKISKVYPEMMQMSQWFLRAADLLNKLPSRENDLIMLMEILNNIEPFIANSKDSNEWQMIKQMAGSLTQFSRGINEGMKETALHGNFDWMKLVLLAQNASEIVKNVSKFVGNPLKEWANLKLQNFQANSTDSVRKLLSIVLTAQSFPPEIQNILKLYDTMLDIAIDLNTMTTELGPFLKRVFTNNANLKKSVLTILREGPATSLAAFTYLSQQMSFDDVLTRPEMLTERICNDNDMAEALRRLDPAVNVTLVHKILCRVNYTAFVETIKRELPVNDVMMKINHLITQAVHSNKTVDMKALLEKSEKVYGMLTGLPGSNSEDLVNSFSSWEKVLTLFNIREDELPKEPWIQYFNQSDAVTTGLNTLVIASIQTLGPLLEKSDMWPSLAPVYMMYDSYYKSNAVTLKLLTDILEMKNTSAIGEFLQYTLHYGSDLLNSISAALQDPSKISMLEQLTMIDWCNADKLAGILSVPSSVPLNEVLHYYCTMNVTKLSSELELLFMSSITAGMLPEADSHSSNMSEPVNWKELAFNIMQVYTLQQRLSSPKLNVFESINVSSLGNALGTIINSTTISGAVPYVIMSMLDQPMSSHRDWRIMKMGMNVANKFNKFDIKATEALVGMKKMSDMFDEDSAGYKLVSSWEKMMPDMMEVMREVMMQPDKMMAKVMKMDPSKTMCNGMSLTDMMDFKDKTNVLEFEKNLCEIMAKPELANEMIPFSSEYREYMESIEEITLALAGEARGVEIPNINLNWTEIRVNQEKFMSLYSSTYMDKYLYEVFPNALDQIGLNVSVMSVNLQKLLNTSGLNMTTYIRMADQLWTMLPQSLPQAREVLHEMTNIIVGQYTFLKFFNKQVDRLSKATSLDNFIKSDEFKKLVRVMQKSPEVIGVLLNALMTNSQAVNGALTAEFSGSPRLCQNFSYFESVFPKPPGSSVSIADVQEAVCETVSINWQKLHTELLDNWDGYKEYVEVLMEPDNKTVSLVEFVKAYEEYMANINKLWSLPVWNSLQDEKWLQHDTWNKALMNITQSYNMVEEYHRLFKGMDDLWNNMPLLVPQAKEVHRMMTNQLAAQNAFYVFFNLQIAEFNVTDPASRLRELEKMEEFSKLTNVSKSSPEIVHVLLHAVTMNQQQVNSALSSGTSGINKLCTSLDYFESVFPKPPTSNISIAAVQKTLCQTMSIDWVKLHEEMQKNMDGYKELVDAMLYAGNDTLSFSFAEYTKNYEQYLTNANELIQNLMTLKASSVTGDKWMLSDTWHQMFNKLAQDLGNSPIASGSVQDAYISAFQQLDALSPMLDNITGWREVRRELEKSQLSAQFALQLLDQLNSTGGPVIDVSKFLKSSEVDKMLVALSMSPSATSLLLNSILLRPEKIVAVFQSVPESFMMLCTNETTFNAVFTPPDGASYPVMQLRQILCETATVNVTLLFQQLLVNVKGLANYVQHMQKLETEIPTKPFNFTEHILIQDAYMMTIVPYMESLVQRKYELGIGDKAWTDGDSWGSVFGKFWSNMQTKLADNTYLNERIRNIIPMLNDLVRQVMIMLVDANPDFVQAMSAENAFVMVLNEELSKYVGANISLASLLKDYAETSKVMDQLGNVSSLFEIFLNTYIQKPTQVSQLISVMSSTTAFCTADLSKLLEVPASVHFDVSHFQTEICKVNWTAVGVELEDMLGNEFIEKVSARSSEPVNPATYLANRLALYETISKLQLLSPTLRFENLPWLNVTMWQNIVNKYSKQLSDMQTRLGSTSAQLLSQLALMSGNMSGQEELLTKSLQALVSMTNLYLKGDLLNWDHWMKNSASEVVKLLNLINMSPDITAVLVHTMLSPEKNAALNQLLQTNVTAVCTIPNLQDYLEVPSGVNLDIQQLQAMLCRLNASLLQAQFTELYTKLFAPVLQLMQPGSTPAVNMTALLMEIQNIQNKLMSNQLPSMSYPPDWLNQTRWAKIGEKLIQAMQGLYANNDSAPSLSSMDISRLLHSVAPMIWMNRDVNIQMKVYSAALGVVIDKISLINVNSIDIAAIFQRSPETKKLLSLMQMSPEIMHVLLASFSSGKMDQLLNGTFEEAMMKLCHPLSNIHDYLTEPPNANISLTALKQEFCQINIASLMTEVQKEFNIEDITKSVESSAPVNLTVLAMRFMKMSDLLTKLTTQSPNLKPQRWMDMSMWMRQLDVYAKSQSNQDIAKSISQSLGLIYSDESLQPFMKTMLFVYNHFASLAIQDLQRMIGRNVTLQTLLSNMPRTLRFISEGIDLTPQILDVFLNNINQQVNSSLLVKIYQSSNFWGSVCNLTRPELEQIFSNPLPVSVSEVRAWFCSVSDRIITEELMAKVQFNKLVSALSQPVRDVNNTETLMNNQQLSQILEELIKNPPNFQMPTLDLIKIQKVLEKSNKLIDVSNLTESLAVFQQQFTTVMNALKDTPAWQPVYQYLKQTKVFWEYMNTLIGKLRPELDMGKLDLRKLVMHSNKTVEMLEKVLSPNMLRDLLNSTIKPEGVGMLIEKNWQVPCNEATMNELLIFPSGFNVTHLVHAVCSVNPDNLKEEFMSEFSIMSFIKAMEATTQSTSTLNWNEFFQTFNDMVYSVTSLFNATSITFKEQNLVDMFAHIQLHEIALWNTIQQSAVPDMSQIPQLTQVMQKLLQAYQGVIDPTNITAIMNFRALEHLIEVFANNLKQIQGKSLTLDSILKNATEAQKLIRSVLGISPESVQMLLNSKINIDKVSSLFSSQDIYKALCTSSIDDLFVLPRNSSYMQHPLQEALCSVNVSLLAEQLSKQFDVNKFIAQLDNQKTSGDSYNLTAAFERIQGISSLIEKLLKNPPKLDAELTALMNITKWLPLLNQMNEAFIKVVLPQLADGIEKAVTSQMAPGSGMTNSMMSLTINEYLRHINKYMKELTDALKLSRGQNAESVTTFFTNVILNAQAQISKNVAQVLNMGHWKMIARNNATFVDLMCNASALSEFMDRTVITDVKYVNSTYFKYIRRPVFSVYQKMNVAVLSKATCGQPPDEWLNRLQQAGFTDEETMKLGAELLGMIETWTCKDYIDPYSNTTSFSCRHIPQPSPYPLRFSDTVNQIQSFADRLKDFQRVNLATKTDIKVLLQNFVSYPGDTLVNIVKLYGLSTYMDWKKLYEVGLYAKFINDHLSTLHNNGTLQFGMLFNNVSAARELLSRVMSERDIAELFMANISPSEFLEWLSMNTTMKNLKCRERYSTTTTARPGSPVAVSDSHSFVNKHNIKTAMCQLLSNESYAQKLFREIGLTSVLKEIARVQAGQKPKVNPYDFFSQQLKQMLQKLLHLSESSLDVSTGLDQLLSQFTTGNYNYLKSADTLWKVMPNFIPQSKDVFRLVSNYMASSDGFVVFMNKQMNKLNDSVSSLKGLVKSDEFTKLVKSLQNSPDLLHVMLNAFMYNSQKVNDALTAEFSGKRRLCLDLNYFESVFPKPPGTNISIMEVQRMLCVAVAVNWEKLYSEMLSGMDGFKEYIDLSAKAMSPNASLSFSIADYVKHYDEYMKNVERIMTLALWQNLSDQEKWLQPHTWTNMLNRLSQISTLNETQMSMENLDQIWKMAKSVPQLQDSMHMVAYGLELHNAYLVFMNKQLVKLTDSVHESVMSLVKTDTARMLLYAYLNDSVKVSSALASEHHGKQRLCHDLDYFGEVFPRMKDVNIATADVQKSICMNGAIDWNKLHDHLFASMDGYKEYMQKSLDTNMVNASVAFSFVDYMKNVEENIKNTERARTLPYLRDLMTLHNEKWLQDIAVAKMWQSFAEGSTLTNFGQSFQGVDDLLKVVYQSLPGSHDIIHAMVNNMAQQSALFKFFNKQMARLSKGSVSNLEGLLDSVEYKKLVKMMQTSPHIVAVLMNAAIINNNKVSTALTEAFSGSPRLCQDLSYFQSVFPNPPASNISLAEVQKTLCDVVAMNWTKLHLELLEKMDGYQEYVEALMSSGASLPTNFTFVEYVKDYETYMKNINRLAGLDIWKMEKWLQNDVWHTVWNSLQSTIMKQGSVSSIGSGCEQLNTLIKDMSANSPELDMKAVHVMFTLLQWEVKHASEIQDLVCRAPKLKISEIYEHFKKMGGLEIMKEIQRIINGNVSMEMDCAAFSESVQTLMTTQQDLFSPEKYEKCDAWKGDIASLNEVDWWMDYVSALFNLSSSMIDLSSLEEMSQIINTVLSSTVRKNPVWSDIGSVLKPGNQSQIQSLLRDSPINLQKLYELLRSPSDNLKNYLCDPAQQKELLNSVPNGPNVTQIAQALCSDTVADQLRESVNVSLVLLRLTALSTYSLDTSSWKTVLADLEELTKRTEMLVQLQSVTSGLDTSEVLSTLRTLQQYLVDQDPQMLFNRFSDIGKKLAVLMGNDTSLVKDIDVFAEGIKGMTIIMKYIPPAVRLRHVMKNDKALEKYMVDELGLSPSVARAVLDSSISLNKILNISEESIRKLVCSPSELQTLVILTDQQAHLAANLSSQLCKISHQLIPNVTDSLLSMLDLGSVIRSLLDFDKNVIFEKANVTKEEVVELLDKFKPVQKQMENLMTQMSNMTSDIELPDDKVLNQLGTTEALSSVSKMMCGEPSMLSVQDDYGIGDVFSSSEKDKEVWTDEQKEEMEDLKTPFCVDMYKMIRRSKAGSVIWSFLKPLLRGRIPFAPDNVLTRSIIQQANETFREISQLQDFARNWINVADQLKNTSGATKGISALKDAAKNPLVANILEQVLSVSVDELSKQMDSLSQLNPTMLKKTKRLAEVLLNATECLVMNRYEGFATEQDLEKRAVELGRKKNMLAAIIFMNIDSDITRKKRSTVVLPKHIQYKIRMGINNVPSAGSIRDMLVIPGPKDNFATDLRYMRGFVQLQDMIDQAIIKVQTGKTLNIPSMDVQQLPYPCHKDDKFQLYVTQYLFPIMMTVAWLVVVGTAVKNLVHDKEIGLEETMKIMGLRSGVNWLAWFLNTMLGMVIMSAIITLIMKVGQLLPYTDGILLFLFLLAFSLSTAMICYMVGAFFTRPTLASLVAVMFYLITYLPFIVLNAVDADLEKWAYFVVCLFSPTAFAYGSKFMAISDMETVGVQFYNADSYHKGDENGFKFSWALYMMLADSVLYALIGWYVSNLKPGKYGLPQPWYFPLLPSYWGCCRGKKKNRHFSYYSTQKFQHPEEEKGPGEIEPRDLPIGISLFKLTKQYKNGVRAVDELTANVYQGQITALLGENGAGKTTTINMLTGFYPSSSGTAFIDGLSVDTQSSQIRKTLGICPQRDVLFDSMTVEEHLMMYAKLKSGQPAHKVQSEVNSMLDSMGLNHMCHVRARDLSGGQRRRLSVGIAFIGQSRVVILDEPTSGVDPAARRSIWDLILQQRAGRTILLSTHHLDEADILADRIIVMHKGKLACSGSPMYLKNNYGSGYTLIIDKERCQAGTQAASQEQASVGYSCSTSEVQAFLDQHLQGVQLIEDIGSEIKFILPRAQTKTNAFYAFFKQLDENQRRLHISSYGVADTSLEEVFFKVCAESDANNRKRPEPMQEASQQPADHSDVRVPVKMSSLKGSRKVEGLSLVMQQMWALLVKRFIHYCRDYRLFFSIVLLPCLFILLAMLCTMIKPTGGNPEPLLLTPDNVILQKKLFLKSEVLSSANQRMTNAFISAPGISTTCMTDSSLRNKCSYSTPKPNLSYPVSCPANRELPANCTCTNGLQKCFSTGKPEAPVYKLISPNELVDLSCYNVEDYIANTFDDYVSDKYGGWSLGGQSVAAADPEPNTVWFHNNLFFHTLPAMINSLSNAVLRANVPANSSQYGISVYSHPLKLEEGDLSQTAIMQRVADTGIALTVVCAFCFVPAGFIIYLVTENINKEKRMQYIHGVGPVLYWVTSVFWDMLSCLVTIGLTIAIMAAFQLPSFTARLNLPACFAVLILFCWSNITQVYLVASLFKETSTAYLTVFVVNLMTGILTTLITFLLVLFGFSPQLKAAHYYLSHILLIFPQFSLGDGLLKIFRNQMLTDLFATFDEDVYKDPFSFDMLAWNLIVMAITGCVFFILTLISAESCRSSKLTRKDSPDHKEDDDVGLERQRVVTGDARSDLLILHNLTKVYRRGFKKVLAVNNVCVGIKKGECFGLLGVNGAGKSTTFNMMTCETRPTRGAAMLNGRFISEGTSAMKQNVGYCPQFDALDAQMNAEEVLFCYGRLKGIPSSELQTIADSALQMMGIESFAKKKVQTLSGGTKRKLSVALALLGDPEMLFLDEPTTGMDPASRRFMWNVLLQVLKENRSVILTSHSMEECDSLCTRLAIMVNGHFTCLGSPQHIKYKFGDGYTLKIKVCGDRADMSNALISVRQSFPRVQLKDEHLNVLELQIPTDDTMLADIFGFLEQQKFKLGIDDYSVSQTSLDQVFVRFAKEQTDGMAEPQEDLSSEGSSGGSSRIKTNAFSNKAYESWPPNGDSDPDIPRAKPNIYDNINRGEELRRSLKSLEQTIEPVGPHSVMVDV